MKKTFATLLLAVAMVTLLSVGIQAGEKKAILIMLDGLRSDGMVTASTPNLDSIRNASWADGYKTAWSLEAHTNLDSPPSSATNHVAIATGVTATKNGCFTNGHTKDTKWNEYPSFLSRLRSAFPEMKTVWLFNWKEDADIQTNATFVGPPRSGFKGDMELCDNAIAFLNGTFPSQEGIQGTRWTAGDDPDVIMLYLDSIDGAGHGHGFSARSPEYIDVIEKNDVRIGDILTTIKNRPTFAAEDWMIVVVSDHGGIDRTHGIVGSQNCYTIPLMVSSKDLTGGRMTGQPQNCDSAAYIMQHFTGSVPECFDGKVETIQTDVDVPITEGLIAYLPFEGDLNPARGDFVVTPGIIPSDFLVDGRVGKAISFRTSVPVSLGKPEALQFGKAGDFTIAFWFRTDEPQIADAPFLSNKDWEDGQRSGIVLAANILSDSGNQLEFNLGDGTNRLDLNPLKYEPNGKWFFVAATGDRDGNAVLYLGDPEGRLSFISDNMKGIGDLNNMEWFLAQDGTGAHSTTYVGDMDEMMIWNRPLTTDEISALFKTGFAGKSILD